MIESLFPTDSIIFIYLEAFFYEIFWVIWYLWRKVYFFVIDSIYELKLILSWPRSSSMKHLIVNKTDRP